MKKNFPSRLRIIIFYIAVVFLTKPIIALNHIAIKNNTHSSKTLEINNSKRKTILLTSDKNSWKMKKMNLIQESLSEVSQPYYICKDWQKAIVPGTILNSLVENGELPEPYFGFNNKITKNDIPDISNVGREYYHYVLRKEFQISKNMQDDFVWLKFHGINYISDIWLNGNYIGKIKGMFKTSTFDISNYINFNGINVLAVEVQPVENPGKPEAALNKENVVVKENRNGGDGEIGKDVTMLMSVGWDFTFSDGIRDRNTGIWRDVEICSTGSIDLRNVFVQTDLNLPDTTISYHTVSVDLINASNCVKGNLKVSIPEYNVVISKPVEIGARTDSTIVFSYKDYEKLVFSNPRLWWVFNKGKQNLASITVEFIDDNKIVNDIEKTNFGIRKITSDINSPDGSRVFYLNGKRLFVRGGNWIPEGMLRISEQRTKTELTYTKQTGINFLRLWGGGISESDYFFSLCDSLGILIWHEFWMTGDTKPPTDQNLYYENVRSTIKRIRNHPSLAYYVSSNEQENVLQIKPILDELDGTRGYQQESECCGVHDGSPYKYENPMQYYDNSASERGSRIDGFCPEYGTVCLPNLEFLREVMNEEDIFPPNKEVWNYLDGNGFHNMTTKYLDAISKFGEVRDIKDFVQKGEIVGVHAYKALWENWNYNKFEFGDRFASGVLFWYHNSPVKQICGRMWDWSLEPTSAFYSVKSALEPIHVQFDYLKNTVSVINEYPYDINNVTVNAEVYNFNSKLVFEQHKNFNITAEEVLNDILNIDFPQEITQIHFISLSLKNKDNKIISENFYLRSNDKYDGPWTSTGPIYSGFDNINNLPKTSIDLNLKKVSENKLIAEVTNKGDNIAFFIRLKGVDSENNFVRKILYQNNYFSILPKSSKLIDINLDLIEQNPSDIKILLEAFNQK